MRSLLAGCAVLDGEGLTTAFGHLSARTEDGTVLISGSLGPGLVRTADDVVRVAPDGVVSEPGLLPGEAQVHLGIMAARADARSVCRFHGPAVLAYGTFGRPLPATTGMGMFLGAQVPVHDTDTTVRTPEQGAALAATLGGANAVLLRGFGAATVGRTVAESVVRAWLLERSADAFLRASAAGTPLVFGEQAAAPFAAGEGPAATQIARAWRWLCARHPTEDET